VPNVQPFESYAEKIKDANLSRTLEDNCTPFSVLKFFIDDNMVAEVIAQSEKFARDLEKKNSTLKFAKFSTDEFWTFMGLHLLMGIQKLPEMRNYWSENPLLNCPIFKEKMSRNRFLEILRNLHFSDNEFPNPNNRFWKLGTFFPDLIAKFRAAINPGEFLSADESFVGYKGRLAFKQYIPSKRCRFGIKLFVLVDVDTNFVLHVIAYQGKKTQLLGETTNLGFGGAAVFTLLEDHFFKNHRVTTDSWFISPNLASILLQHGTFLIGTARKTRKNMPKMKGKIPKGSAETYSTENILVERFSSQINFVKYNVKQNLFF